VQPSGDSLQKRHVLLLLRRVPKELLALNVSAPHQMYQQHKTRMALVWHEKTLPREDEEQQQQQQQQEQQQRQQERQRQAADLRELHRAAAGRFYPDSDDDSCDYGSGDDPYMDEDMELYVERMMGGCGRPSSSTYRRPPVGVRFGLPRLVVIPELHLHGGDAADKAVRKVGAGCADVLSEGGVSCCYVTSVSLPAELNLPRWIWASGGRQGALRFGGVL
jgi:hypothetical protein